MALWQRNLLLAIVAVLLAVVPLALIQGAEWGGADQQSVDAIQELQADYEPWFESVFSPEEFERYVFGLQALLGTLAGAAFLGWLIGRRHAQTGVEGNERRIAAIIAAIGIVLALGLFFVETEFGEIQAFISAVQGVGAGTLGFFLGYPMGRRSRAAVSGTSATARVAG